MDIISTTGGAVRGETFQATSLPTPSAFGKRVRGVVSTSLCRVLERCATPVGKNDVGYLNLKRNLRSMGIRIERNTAIRQTIDIFFRMATSFLR